MAEQYDINIKRHSLAHVMATAVFQLFGTDVKFGVGPTIDNGCYYDFVLPRNIVPEDLIDITKKTRELLNQDLIFEKEIIDLKKAVDYFENTGQVLKVELLNDLAKHGTTSMDEIERELLSTSGKELEITLYHLKEKSTGIILFTDLCRGPHVESMSDIRGMGISADKFSAAYWRGDQERNISMQRIYMLGFEDETSLNKFTELREEAIKRDHRVLGRDLELFFFHESAPGIPYWLPKGLKMKNLLIEYWRQYHMAHGYQEFAGPLLNKKDMWVTSGHWDHYQDDMITAKVKGGDVWALKPMSCPGAIMCYQFKKRSYKELPLRLCDVDMLHRDEIPGALHGLMRARSFMQDDSHNFIREDQIKDEVLSIIEIVKDFYALFGMSEGVKMYLSTRPDDYIGEIAVWDKAENDLREILDGSGFEYGIKEKDGAFYGPKIDIQLQDALGREWQCGTIQLDFQLPGKFDLLYTAEDGTEMVPVLIHRVIYGSLERFIGILIEHFAGRMPYWIAPVQVRVLTINDQMGEYVGRVKSILENVVLQVPVRGNELRFEIDERSESLGKKIREAEMSKVPVILIVGPKDAEVNQVSARVGGKEEKVSIEKLGEYLLSI